MVNIKLIQYRSYASLHGQY